MPDLSDTQRNRLAPDGDHPRDGVPVPNTDQPPFSNAACWAWALTGSYEAVDGDFTANTIYTSDAGAFTFDGDRVPTGLNSVFFVTTDEVFPQTVQFHEVLTANIADAIGGNEDAQGACRVALMKLTAVCNGHDVLSDDGSDVYTMVMNTSHWYSWDHWAIGIRSAANPDTRTFQQKVTDTPLKYNCGVMWDEHQPLVTVLRLNGLVTDQVTVLNRVV